MGKPPHVVYIPTLAEKLAPQKMVMRSILVSRFAGPCPIILSFTWAGTVVAMPFAGSFDDGHVVVIATSGSVPIATEAL